MENTAAPTNIQVLSAMDFGPDRFGRTPDVDALVADLGDALLRVVTHQLPDCRRDAAPDATVAEHLLVFDAGMLRNTEAHGMGYRRAFVVCVRQLSDVQGILDADDADDGYEEFPPTCPVCDGVHGSLCPIESPDPGYYADELVAGR